MPPPSNDSVSGKKTQRFYWKGKRVTKKAFEANSKRQKWCNVLNTASAAHAEKNNDTAVVNIEKKVEGRRIINLDYLGQQMFCKSCEKELHLTNIVEEKRCGLASILHIKCKSCGMLTQVATDKQHQTVNVDQRKHFDTNTKALVGVLNGGLGSSHLNKLLTAMNIPAMNWKTFKAHQDEVGKVVEKMALESCERAALEEKELTVKNEEKMKELL